MPAFNYYGQNYGNPNGFFYPQPMPQPVQPAQMSPANQPINQSGIIWISGLQEAQMYPIAPNNAVALWQKDGKTIYLKSADATGRPTLTVYDLVQRAETATESSGNADGNSPAYATQEDLSKVVNVVSGINDVINTLKGDVETMKGDIYGIAGKRNKKKEAVEDDA